MRNLKRPWRRRARKAQATRGGVAAPDRGIRRSAMGRPLIRAFTVLMLVATFPLSSAQPQPAAPAPTESGQPLQAETANDQHHAGGDSASPAVPPKREQCSEVAGQPADEKTSADWWMVRLTGGLLLVAALQVFAFVQQLRLMRDALGEARVSAEAARAGAEAAKQSAAAVAALERPWLVVETVGDPEWVADSPEQTTVPDDESALFLVTLRITNIGRSPAWITSEGIAWTGVPMPVPDALPMPEQTDPMKLSRAPIAPGGSQTATETIILGADERRAMLRSARATVVYGLIVYRAATVSERCETAFCVVIAKAATAFSWSSEAGQWQGTTQWQDSTWWSLEGPESYIRNT